MDPAFLAAVVLAHFSSISKTTYLVITFANVGVIAAGFAFRGAYLAWKRRDPVMTGHVQRVKQVAPTPIKAVVAGGWAKISGEIEAEATGQKAAPVQLTEHLRGYPAPRGATTWMVAGKDLKASSFDLRDASGCAQVRLSFSGAVGNDERESSLIEAGGGVFLFSRAQLYPDGERTRRQVRAIRAGDHVTVVGKPELLPDGAATGYREASGGIPCFDAGEATLYVLHGSEEAFARAASGNMARLLMAGTCALLLGAAAAVITLIVG